MIVVRQYTCIPCMRIPTHDDCTQQSIGTQSDMKNLDIRSLATHQSLTDLKELAMEAAGLCTSGATLKQWDNSVWQTMAAVIKLRCKASLELIQYLNLNQESKIGKIQTQRIINFVKIGVFIKANMTTLALLDGKYTEMLNIPPPLDS